MDTCAMCGAQAEKLPFTIFYNPGAQQWELGSNVCQECARQVLTDDLDVLEREDEESERFHAWADTQR